MKWGGGGGRLMLEPLPGSMGPSTVGRFWGEAQALFKALGLSQARSLASLLSLLASKG